jgi:hypothetical protein
LNDVRYVGINQPVRVIDMLAKMDDEKRAMTAQRMQLVPGDPRLYQVIEVENDITSLDVDISIAEGIDVPSIQNEQFQTLVQLAGMQPGLIPPEVLIAASGLRDKEMLLERLKEHQKAGAEKQQKAEQIATAGAQADIQGKQAKAAADMALAQERKINSVRGVHGMHAEYSAPPYGQPYTADNAAQPQSPPVDPTQMTPEMAMAHHMTELAKMQAEIRNKDASTALTAAKIPQTHHQTLNTLIQADRLARTPIPRPAAPTAR